MKRPKMTPATYGNKTPFHYKCTNLKKCHKILLDQDKE
jgi:hypothetical protein